MDVLGRINKQLEKRQQGSKVLTDNDTKLSRQVLLATSEGCRGMRKLLKADEGRFITMLQSQVEIGLVIACQITKI